MLGFKLLPGIPSGLSDYVFVCGCFDILHPGHMTLLQQASRFGPVVVGLNSDESIEALKGKLPFFNEQERVAMLEGLEYVDQIFVFNATDARDTVRKVCPKLWILGSDHQKEIFDDLPCPVAFVNREINSYSSSKIKELLEKK